jgi:hypothetical protein
MALQQLVQSPNNQQANSTEANGGTQAFYITEDYKQDLCQLKN